MRHLLTLDDISSEELIQLFVLADKYLSLMQNGKEQLDVCRGKILATLFYEASTRTRLSFETAMLRLGGQVISVVGVDGSSLSKGESLTDTGVVISAYADIIAMRHPLEGSVKELSMRSSIPVVNCGDGPANHPTQAILDAYTIYREFGKLDNLKIALVGDLLWSRTSHSLLELLAKFENNFVKLCSPKSLSLDKKYFFDSIRYQIVDDLPEAITDVDIIYSSRVQKERFTDLDEYNSLKNYFVFDLALLTKYANSSIIMHALPRVDEILPEVDTFHGARYFDAVRNGIFVRMAILDWLLNY